jgi:hypothetical protein
VRGRGIFCKEKDMANVTETVMLVLTAVNVAIVAYTLVVDRAEKAAARAREWRARFYQFKEEIRANLRVIEALEREDLNNNAIANPAIRALICQLRGSQTAAADYDFFAGLKKHLARKGKHPVSVIDPAQTLSLARDTARKIRSLVERAELAEESAPNAQRTLAAPRVAAIRSRLDALSAALAG